MQRGVRGKRTAEVKFLKKDLAMLNLSKMKIVLIGDSRFHYSIKSSAVVNGIFQNRRVLI